MIRYHWDAVIGKYVLDTDIRYFSKRYRKYVYINKGFTSDGATGAVDISSTAWWVHDYLKEYGKFSDGTKCTNWQASTILYDILLSEGRWFRARSWWLATLIWGEFRGRT